MRSATVRRAGAVTFVLGILLSVSVPPAAAHTPTVTWSDDTPANGATVSIHPTVHVSAHHDPDPTGTSPGGQVDRQYSSLTVHDATASPSAARPASCATVRVDVDPVSIPETDDGEQITWDRAFTADDLPCNGTVVVQADVQSFGNDTHAVVESRVITLAVPPAALEQFGVVRVDGQRAFTLTWAPALECDNLGVVVYRSIAGRDFKYLASVFTTSPMCGGEPREADTFTDDKLPPAGSDVAYSVQAARLLGSDDDKGNPEVVLGPPTDAPTLQVEAGPGTPEPTAPSQSSNTTRTTTKSRTAVAKLPATSRSTSPTTLDTGFDPTLDYSEVTPEPAEQAGRPVQVTTDSGPRFDRQFWIPLAAGMALLVFALQGRFVLAQAKLVPADAPVGPGSGPLSLDEWSPYQADDPEPAYDDDQPFQIEPEPTPASLWSVTPLTDASEESTAELQAWMSEGSGPHAAVGGGTVPPTSAPRRLLPRPSLRRGDR